MYVYCCPKAVGTIFHRMTAAGHFVTLPTRQTDGESTTESGHAVSILPEVWLGAHESTY